MKTYTVSTSKPYEVIIEKGALKNIAPFVAEKFPAPRKVCVITDSNVGTLYGAPVIESLAEAGFDAFRINFPAGEHSKNLTTYMNILESLADRGMTKSDIILALGGGVVGDISGFAAGTYMRGIEYIHVPTTLLSAIDSSIGGKTAVNLMSGKNLAGLFWQPALVVTDPEMVGTLSEYEIQNGLGEALKSAVISDGSLVSHIQDRNYEYIIDRCISIKKSIVDVDENDTGIRQLLNFGHTLAHGIEKLSSYSVSHGQAVAKGMVGESKAAFAMGYTKNDISGELVRIITSLDMDPSLDYDPEEIYQHAMVDKKIRDNMINIIVPDLIGKCTLKKISLDELKEFIFAAFS